jgi:DNA-binding response OmpR family regulator
LLKFGRPQGSGGWDRRRHGCESVGVNAPPPRVLLVEDDTALRDAIASALGASGYDVHAAANGLRLDEVTAEFRPDAAILDVRLDDGPDGFGLALALRRRSDMPLLFVTAADRLDDRLRGFEVGADDYIVKPFAVAELLARMRALLRRTGSLVSSTWQVRDLVVDESERIVRRDGHPIDLTKTEFELLMVLVRAPGRVFSKTQLLSLVWGFDEFAPNLVEVHMSALRRKLEAHGPRLIHTERSVGYVVRP